MSGDNSGLAGKIPPDWVRLRDVPYWIEIQFHERPSDQWMMELIDLLKREPTLNRGELILPYRVQGLSASPDTYLPNGPKGTPRQDLPGLKVSLHDPLDTSVASWDQANFDTRDFTVAGAPRPDGGRTRHEIELLWVNVVKRETQRIDQRKRQQQREAETKITTATAEPSPHPPARLPPFNAKQAQALLIAKKVGGDWASPPTEDESREFLLLHFNGVPNDPHRAIRHTTWRGLIKRGPRTKRLTAE